MHEFVTNEVVAFHIRSCVDFTIHFNNKPSCWTVEVCDISTDPSLPSEFESKQSSILKTFPEHPFSDRRVVTQYSAKFGMCMWVEDFFHSLLRSKLFSICQLLIPPPPHPEEGESKGEERARAGDRTREERSEGGGGAFRCL